MKAHALITFEQLETIIECLRLHGYEPGGDIGNAVSKAFRLNRLQINALKLRIQELERISTAQQDPSEF